jgi:hypothetical protein
MALSLKAERILRGVYYDALAIVEGMDLTWTTGDGETYQNVDELKAIVKPMLAPHIDAGVKLSYSKDNSLNAPAFNVTYDISKTMIERAERTKRDAERKRQQSLSKTVKSIRLSVEGELATAGVMFLLPDGEEVYDLLVEVVKLDNPNGAGEAQAKLLTRIADKLKPN